MRGAIFKYRGLLWGLFGAAILVFPVSFSAARSMIAIPLLAGGQLLRFWAAGVIPKYRTLTLDAPRLVTWGPYAFVRNPLYAGNALMGCGWSLMAGWLWVATFAAAFLSIYTFAIIPYEESFLAGKFGGEYLRYKSVTPALIPAFSGPGRPLAGELFDPGRSWFMERHSLFMNAAVTTLVGLRLLVFDYKFLFF
jgi:protein-S-isoprenylcysteine O-methyltransferase Ste14